MGVSSIDGSVSEPMLDAEQRKSAYHPIRLLCPCLILNILAYFAEPELVSLLPRAAEMHVIISWLSHQKERGGTKETGKEQRKESAKEKQWSLTSRERE